mmetsp:Transcript_8338/g.20832  ORF Transcript_8338/g.20832 Transcript_8338/m.20832 type:complete len:136 (-) Transcript_8338:777-1184(-)
MNQSFRLSFALVFSHTLRLFRKGCPFFTGADQDIRYDVETQLCTVRFLLVMARKMWHNDQIGQPERLVLLQLLEFYMSGCGYYDELYALCDSFPDKMETSVLKELMRIIQYGSPSSKHDFVVRASNNSQLLQHDE